ncbi:FIST N-terminal domain-containing protein [Polyangium sp. y55x31]|uniref:FIST signal transduction protein n=1 Tax=Polyangium sp. y55x31 TaxID=3042688 RepID=UPI0024831167|nr:FIST N-terminal domain-containing protein [Polyangium sp. y55x31]MDI1475935.1 FIST N-terminal domain-containing protein [Polyangium sp. y55x31]
MPVRTAHATVIGADDVARAMRAELASVEPVVVLYFAGGRRDPRALAEAMQRAFPGALVVGCTTAGEREGRAWRKGSVVAMALGSEIVRDAAVAVIEDVRSRADVKDALAPLETHFGRPLSSLDPSQHVGLLLIDGLSNAEERLMDRLGDLTDIPILGGSAGDDLTFTSTWVAKDGMAFTNAAVLLLLEPAVPFRAWKTQSFRPLDRTLRVTACDEAGRVVHAFDGKPAAARYAEVLGIPPEELAHHFQNHPLGLMVGDEPFVRSPQQIRGESVVFYCNVPEGTVLTVLEASDIVEDTRRALATAREELGGASALIGFDCVLRTLEIETRGLVEPYGTIFEGIPTVGFSTYGEQFLGHVNQTATMLLFG